MIRRIMIALLAISALILSLVVDNAASADEQFERQATDVSIQSNP